MREVLVIDCKARESFWSSFGENNKILFASTVREGLSLLSDNVDLIFLNLDSNQTEVSRLIKKAYPSIEHVIIVSSGNEGQSRSPDKKDHKDLSGMALNAEEIIHDISSRIKNESD